MVINGKHCFFDFSRCPNRSIFAANVVEYVDRKVPDLFQMVGVAVPKQSVQITFAQISGGQFRTPNLIELSEEHLENDLGCLVHECVHWTQLPENNVYHSRQQVFEGVADYYRILLSDDKQGDYFNNDKRNLVDVFDQNELYNSGSEFIAYLRRRSGDPLLVKQLNDVLRKNKIELIDQFFQDRFRSGFSNLLAEYPSQRAAVIGKVPSEVSRYGFFANMH